MTTGEVRRLSRRRWANGLVFEAAAGLSEERPADSRRSCPSSSARWLTWWGLNGCGCVGGWARAQAAFRLGGQARPG